MLSFLAQDLKIKFYYILEDKQHKCKTTTLQKKLEKDLELHKELHHLYTLITKLVLVCLRKELKLVIENPYSEQHYLHRYWALEPKIIDTNRRDDGDYYKKPTQYFFVNFEPYNNLVMDEAIEIHPKRTIKWESSTVQRSMISKGYARRFIRTYLIKGE